MRTIRLNGLLITRSMGNCARESIVCILYIIEFCQKNKIKLYQYVVIHLRVWYNICEHNEPSGWVADIWRMCATHDEAERSHGKYFHGKHP